jgi:endonuclease/exonuclease/phosphatase (EEP) superfamily protein YafD
MSKHPISQAVRKQYPVDDSFPNRFFDLDRAFSVTVLPVTNGKNLVLINSHMSAYDKGGVIRKQQLEVLNAYLAEAIANGDYVIVGGEFQPFVGSDILTAFPSQQEIPEWVHVIDDADLTAGMRIVKAGNRTTTPTCRSTDMPYRKGVNYTAVLDGFLVSDNVTATAKNVDNQFAYSDHQPVVLTFTLKP